MMPLPTTEAISAERVSKRFGTARVLESVSLEIRRGEVFGLLGPNGAGKTTLVELVVGLRRPDAGHLRLLGHDPGRDRQAAVRDVGFQPQGATLFPRLTVRELLELWAATAVAPLAMAEVVERIALGGFVDRQVRHLSRGQRQRALLGLALIRRPELLILDEPTDGLDPEARHLIWDVVAAERDSGRTVLLTTHMMDEAQALCDRIAVLERGRVLALDTPAALVDRFVPERTIAFRTTMSPQEEVLAALPGVTAVETVAAGPLTSVMLLSRVPAETLHALLSTLAPPAVRALEVRAGTLEEAFIALTANRAAA
jgi:ABC-2 type transport system ATP-binding protein